MKTIPSKMDLLKFFYPREEGGERYWGGWNRFFSPSIPSRLFHEGERLLANAIDNKKTVPAIIFFQTSHIKRLSLAGRGEKDVKCKPTPEAKKAVELLKKYGAQ